MDIKTWGKLWKQEQDKKMIDNEAQSINNWEKIGMIKEKRRIINIIDKIKFQTIHSGNEGTNCMMDVVSVEQLKRLMEETK